MGTTASCLLGSLHATRSSNDPGALGPGIVTEGSGVGPLRPRHEREGYEKPPEATSARMRAVARADTPPEVILRRALWKLGLRYRLRRRVGPARPDVVFPGPKVAVFVDGCFWHGCPVHYKAPVNNANFWRRRVETNRQRDRRHAEELARGGWHVLRFWECDVQRCLDDVARHVNRAVTGP
jgi:DNA mismatch endonuclease (patch repair protein)